MATQLPDIAQVFRNSIVVNSYETTFTTKIRSRLEGQSLLEAWPKEFRACSKESVRSDCELGSIQVNGMATDGSVVLHTGDKVTHTVMRREPVGRAFPVLRVLGLTKDIVALNKPSMVPVHSCGKYGKLSALGIAQMCHPKLRGLRPANRIDLATSGVFLAARSSAAARQVQEAIVGS